MKTILKLLITSDLWLEVIDLNNANYIKKEIGKELMPVA